jgi:hypothetical protein
MKKKHFTEGTSRDPRPEQFKLLSFLTHFPPERKKTEKKIQSFFTSFFVIILMIIIMKVLFFHDAHVLITHLHPVLRSQD